MFIIVAPFKNDSVASVNLIYIFLLDYMRKLFLLSYVTLIWKS